MAKGICWVKAALFSARFLKEGQARYGPKEYLTSPGALPRLKSYS